MEENQLAKDEKLYLMKSMDDMLEKRIDYHVNIVKI